MLTYLTPMVLLFSFVGLSERGVTLNYLVKTIAFLSLMMVFYITWDKALLTDSLVLQLIIGNLSYMAFLKIFDVRERVLPSFILVTSLILSFSTFATSDLLLFFVSIFTLIGLRYFYFLRSFQSLSTIRISFVLNHFLVSTSLLVLFSVLFFLSVKNVSFDNFRVVNETTFFFSVVSLFTFLVFSTGLFPFFNLETTIDLEKKDRYTKVISFVFWIGAGVKVIQMLQVMQLELSGSYLSLFQYSVLAIILINMAIVVLNYVQTNESSNLLNHFWNLKISFLFPFILVNPEPKEFLNFTISYVFFSFLSIQLLTSVGNLKTNLSKKLLVLFVVLSTLLWHFLPGSWALKQTKAFIDADLFPISFIIVFSFIICSALRFLTLLVGEKDEVAESTGQIYLVRHPLLIPSVIMLIIMPYILD